MTNAAPAEYPGKTLGLVGLILAIVAPVLGLILSIVANSQSKAAGVENKLAKAGIIVGIILTVLGVIFSIIYVSTIGAALSTVPTSGY